MHDLQATEHAMQSYSLSCLLSKLKLQTQTSFSFQLQMNQLFTQTFSGLHPFFKVEEEWDGNLTFQMWFFIFRSGLSFINKKAKRWLEANQFASGSRREGTKRTFYCCVFNSALGGVVNGFEEHMLVKRYQPISRKLMKTAQLWPEAIVGSSNFH